MHTFKEIYLKLSSFTIYSLITVTLFFWSLSMIIFGTPFYEAAGDRLLIGRSPATKYVFLILSLSGIYNFWCQKRSLHMFLTYIYFALWIYLPLSFVSNGIYGTSFIRSVVEAAFAALLPLRAWHNGKPI